MKKCNNSDEGDKLMISIQQRTSLGHSSTQHDNHNPDFKINSAMILTFVFINRNAVTVAANIKKKCVNMYKGHGYVVVYRSKIKQVYCEYKDDIKCDGIVVRYILPL